MIHITPVTDTAGGIFIIHDTLFMFIPCRASIGCLKIMRQLMLDELLMGPGHSINWINRVYRMISASDPIIIHLVNPTSHNMVIPISELISITCYVI
ncbi:hypothetical protein C440_00175 [Haloferax mucosum ATCC BAA-1512]|uniref:Uncharacterized protein n=1 Tax=Haloferax mucosum ATCC BAA-1512 TaxID=662479 RepID=M0IPR3_9EURY|nr:hypothetical protein C440_00175 [Haloferax mucosum ATCC BAA-1512]